MSAAPARPTTNLDEQLCFALYAATNVVVRAYRPLLQPHGLTYPQYLIMLVLWHDGPQTVGNLADRLRLPASAISPMLERMRANGLLTRRRDRSDRRVVHVEATERGQALEAEVGAIQRDVECQTTLGHAELEALRDELRVLVARMTERQGPRPV